MTSPDLDAELRAVLGAPMTDSQVAALDARVRPTLVDPARGVARRPSASPNRRRQLMLLVAATIAILAAASAVVSQEPPVDLAQMEANNATTEVIFADVGPIFAGCRSFAEGRAMLRQRLDALGFRDWRIESNMGAENSRCVTAAGSGERVIFLIPSMGDDVAATMERVRQDLMSRCLDSRSARAFVSAELTGLGVTRFSVRTDWPLALPIGQEQQVLDHISQGCAVYNGAQPQTDGSYVFYVAG